MTFRVLDALSLYAISTGMTTIGTSVGAYYGALPESHNSKEKLEGIPLQTLTLPQSSQTGFFERKQTTQTSAVVANNDMNNPKN